MLSGVTSAQGSVPYLATGLLLLLCIASILLNWSVVGATTLVTRHNHKNNDNKGMVTLSGVLCGNSGMVSSECPSEQPICCLWSSDITFAVCCPMQSKCGVTDSGQPACITRRHNTPSSNPPTTTVRNSDNNKTSSDNNASTFGSSSETSNNGVGSGGLMDGGDRLSPGKLGAPPDPHSIQFSANYGAVAFACLVLFIGGAFHAAGNAALRAWNYAFWRYSIYRGWVPLHDPLATLGDGAGGGDELGVTDGSGQDAPSPTHSINIDERDLCSICFTSAIATVLLKCGHACVCAGCARRLTSCPLCRSPIHTILYPSRDALHRMLCVSSTTTSPPPPVAVERTEESAATPPPSNTIIPTGHDVGRCMN